MAPVSRNDEYILSTDPGFRNRVQEALVAAAVAITNEARTVPAGFPAWAVADYYEKRASLAARVQVSPAGLAAEFANMVAADANVINDATAVGTVPLTAGNVAAQALLVTDAHLDAAIAGVFNAAIALG